MRRMALLGVAFLGMPGLAFASCEELKARIAEGMTSRGFTAFELEIVAAEAPETGKVVGRCEERTKKILYSNTFAAAVKPAVNPGAAAASAPRVSQPQASGTASVPASSSKSSVTAEPASTPAAAPAVKSSATAAAPRAVVPAPAIAAAAVTWGAAPAAPRGMVPEAGSVSAAQPASVNQNAAASAARVAPSAATSASLTPSAGPKPSTATSPRVPAKPSRNVAPGAALRDALGEGGQGPLLVVIPGGEFIMGSSQPSVDRRYSEGPEHRVKVPAFALARTETTFDDYDRFATATGRRMPDDGGLGRGTRPVTDVSWLDAMAYAQWLTAQTGFTYRLPSEAEWEYAARAGGKAGLAYSTGDCISAKQANFNDAAVQFKDCPTTGVNLGRSQPVGSYPANAFGVHDMHGNVFEWTADCVHLSYTEAPSDGSAWLQDAGGKCSERMVRGGSWQSGQVSVRSSLRAAIGYSDASTLIGFRVARSL
jgi:formylglycine-generating enzyme required for sulfatase activity